MAESRQRLTGRGEEAPQMYEARPGMWLMVGVTLEEHEQAMAGNYEPGRDEYYEELFKEDLQSACNERLLDRDLLQEWKTKDGRILKLHEMDDDHVYNTIRFLQRHDIDVERFTPNLCREFQSRFKEAP